MNTNPVVVFNKLIVLILLFLPFSKNIFAQVAQNTEHSDISILKDQFYSAQTDSTKARISAEISTVYRFNLEVDSCKKYASIAIGLTNNINNPKLKHNMIKAKAIENYGFALSYDNAKKGIDTLQYALKLWKKTNNKEGIANAYFSLAEGYSLSSNKIESLKNFKKSLSLHRELNNKAKEAEALYFISLEERYLGNLGDALEYSLKSLKLAEEVKDTSLMTAAILANSFNYLYAKNYDEALQEQKKALHLLELINDSIGIARTYNDMGVTSMYSGELDDALYFHQKALDIRKKVDLSSVGISYNYIAELYIELDMLNKALESIMQGLPYTIRHGDNRFIIDDYIMAGNIYLELKDFEQALTYYNMAAKIAEENNNKEYQARALMYVGNTYKQAGNTDKALEYLKSADLVVNSKDFKRRKFVYEKLMETYADRGNYRSAFEYQTKFRQMSDSVSAAVKAEKIASLTQELMYENKRAIQKASQDKEIALKESELNTQKLIRNISIAGLLLILVFAVIYYKRFKEKRALSLSLEKTLSDLKSTQQQLIQSEKMASLGELTAGIAHEIQNPLNFVNNFSEVSSELIDEMKDELNRGDIEEAKAISEDLKQNLNKINHHGKRADSIVKGMLQHSRASGNKKEPTDINALADEYMRLAYHGLRAKDKSFNANLESHYDEGIEKIKVIPQDIGRVILNLFTNAFYAVNEKKLALGDDNSYVPTVSVTTKVSGLHIRVSVKDNGDGIPKEMLNKIFQPFFTTKPTGQGTGLGLSMSYDIIKTHGGTLEVDTEKGQYTEFIIKIPI